MISPLLSQTSAAALVELLEVSPQVDAAVVFERSSADLLAFAPPTAEDSTRRFNDVAARILDAAERARTELGREPVTQCEVATGDGHVFVVADADHVVAAVTAAEPTVGLVFYDLKTALRAVRDAASSTAPPTSVSPPGASPTIVRGPHVAEQAAPASEPADVDADAVADATSHDGDAPVSTGRFRRRKS